MLRSRSPISSLLTSSHPCACVVVFDSDHRVAAAFAALNKRGVRGGAQHTATPPARPEFAVYVSFFLVTLAGGSLKDVVAGGPSSGQTIMDSTRAF